MADTGCTEYTCPKCSRTTMVWERGRLYCIMCDDPGQHTSYGPPCHHCGATLKVAGQCANCEVEDPFET